MENIKELQIDSRIRALRLRAGLRQWEVANELGVGVNTVWKWEHNAVKIRRMHSEAMENLVSDPDRIAAIKSRRPQGNFNNLQENPEKGEDGLQASCPVVIDGETEDARRIQAGSPKCTPKGFSGEELRFALTELGMSRGECAMKLGVTPDTVNRWMWGSRAKVNIPGPAARAMEGWLQDKRKDTKLSEAQPARDKCCGGTGGDLLKNQTPQNGIDVPTSTDTVIEVKHRNFSARVLIPAGTFNRHTIHFFKKLVATAEAWGLEGEGHQRPAGS